MKVLLYINEDKDSGGRNAEKLKRLLSEKQIEYVEFKDGEFPENKGLDGIFVLGGDGTILRRTEIANAYCLPIIGINAGKLGFLSEFEISEMEEAVDCFVSGKLVKDERTTMKIVYNGKSFYALNDVIVERRYEDNRGMVINVSVKIACSDTENVIGDGVIVATPTGSTGYSLSAGGSVLAPGINAFCVTAIAPHSLRNRPIIFSADYPCELFYTGGAKAGLFVDGKLVANLNVNDKVSVGKAERPTVFLRRKNFDFFRRLRLKLQDR